MAQEIKLTKEYDTPLNLFDKHDSLFRGLCDKKVGRLTHYKRSH